jgi:hypothetical protein
VKPREFIGVFGLVAAVWSPANAEELVPMEVIKPSNTTRPQIELVRVKPVERIIPNPRLSEGVISLMKDFNLSRADGMGSA